MVIYLPGQSVDEAPILDELTPREIVRELDKHVRCRSLPVRRQLRLPCLWAGFKPAAVAMITGDGPEMEAYSRRTGKSVEQLMDEIRREHFGLSLFPLPWVSHHWQQAMVVYADLARFPQRQVFPFHRLTDSLTGFQDAAEFDLLRTRFCLSVKRCPRRPRRPVSISA